MEKFSLLCTLSALIVFLGAAIGAAGVQTGKSNSLPFGMNSVEQIQTSASFNKSVSVALSQGLSGSGRLDVPSEIKLASRAKSSVPINGDILVSF